MPAISAKSRLRPSDRRLARLIITLSIIALAIRGLGPLMADTAYSPADPRVAASRLERSIDVVKREFEESVVGVSNQRQISALALRAAAEAWLEAAVHTNLPSGVFDPVESVAIFEKEWDKAEGSWAAREGQALRFQFETLARLTARLAARSGDQQTADNLALLLNVARDGQKRSRPLTVPAIEAENKVFWSNRLCALAAILASMGGVKEGKESLPPGLRQGRRPGQQEGLSQGRRPDRQEGLSQGQRPGQQEGQGLSQGQNQRLGQSRLAEVTDVVEDLLNRSEVVARRADIHYQAKMELLYLNNARGLTELLFIMAEAENSPLTQEARLMEEAWNNHLNETDLRVAARIGLTWVANTQLVFPLAWWLATDLKATAP